MLRSLIIFEVMSYMYNIMRNFIIVISNHSNSLHHTVLASEDDRRSTKMPCFKLKVVIHFLKITKSHVNPNYIVTVFADNNR